MGSGFEVDWGSLNDAGSRLLMAADEVTASLDDRLGSLGHYGAAGLTRAVIELEVAWARHGVSTIWALEGLGNGLKESARRYTEADALGAALLYQRFVE